MGFSSSLTLLRGFLVASLVPLQDFGLFAILIAIGIFCSTLLGLGQIEGTMKAFPRAWSIGQARQVCLASDALAHKILVRAVAAVILACLIFSLTGHTEKIKMVLMVAGISIGAALMGIYSSMLRASGDLKQLGRSTFTRSFLALFFCSAGAFTFGWLGAIVGELFASIIAAIQARSTGRRLIDLKENSENTVKADNLNMTQSLSDGRWLLFAMLVISIPFYLDRLFIAALFDSSVAGQYSFLMLFVTGASTFAGIIVQKVGPDLVKGAQRKMEFSYQCKIALRWMSIHVIVMTIGIGAFGILTLVGPLKFLGEQYQISIGLILVTILIASMQSSVILDWLLISKDHERLVFGAAIIYFFILSVFLFFVVLMRSNFTLIDIMMYMSFCKFMHLFSQFLFIIAKVNEKKISS